MKVFAIFLSTLLLVNCKPTGLRINLNLHSPSDSSFEPYPVEPPPPPPIAPNPTPGYNPYHQGDSFPNMNENIYEIRLTKLLESIINLFASKLKFLQSLVELSAAKDRINHSKSNIATLPSIVTDHVTPLEHNYPKGAFHTSSDEPSETLAYEGSPTISIELGKEPLRLALVPTTCNHCRRHRNTNQKH